MISIKSTTFKNFPKTLEFSKEILHIQSLLSEHNEKEPFPQTTKGLLSTISFITKEASSQSLLYINLHTIGLVAYNDKLLINPFLFSIFINWDEGCLDSIILRPEFNCASITRSQFLSLIRKHSLSGSILDWKLLSYPHEEESKAITSSLLPIGGESFFIASDFESKTVEPEHKLCLMSANIFSKKPRLTIWETFKDIPCDQFFLKFADLKVSPNKCWLLYKENNT